ncbi:MAG: aminopeptidase P family protein [Acidobacteriota bacterium]|nr:aminopeptidase P family protein [Acidobacteriota bacterium]
MKKIATFAFLTVFSLSAATPLKANVADRNAPPAIRVAPSAPDISDAERQMELAKRRAAAAAQMADNSMLILMSAEPKNYAGDVDFLYRQENNLYYLTNLKQKGAALILTKNGGQTNEFLFLPKRSPAQETWNGKMYSREEANKTSGVKTIIDSPELKDFLQSVKDKKSFASKDGVSIANAATVYMLLPEDESDGDGKAEYRRENEFAKSIAAVKFENARPLFENLRIVKSPLEIKLLQHAIDITTEAQERAMAMVGKAAHEYEVQAEVEFTFRRRNADYWGYPSIVGCGVNATTLHYEEAEGAVKAGDLMLMDVGAEYDHYTADVTRTYPVNGVFSKEQAEIYNAVYDAQEAAAKKIKPGASYREPAQAATESLKQSLTKLGLITAPNATYQILYQGKPINYPQYQIWFMHGWGHWLGMNVHDVGGDGATILKPGMVTTNEPGIYIREDALDYLPDTPDNKKFLEKIRPAYEKYKTIGVRIEDDMLVTANGVEWLTVNLPRKISDIEALMAQASKEMNYTAKLDSNPTLSVLNLRGIFDRQTNRNGLSK